VAAHFPALNPHDSIQLAALAATASNAASTTAHAVDSVVKEAVLFFTTLRPMQNDTDSQNVGSEVFKRFGKDAQAEAHAAAEACAEVHQHVANGDGLRGGGRTSGINSQASMMAASRVCSRADGITQIAREAAQLCMGILEEAVKHNATPLARETAKRSAEQALHSIEAANAAEQHSQSLRALLTRLLQGSELQETSSPAGVSASGESCAVQDSAPTPPPSGAQARGTDVQDDHGASTRRRWWDLEPEAVMALRYDAGSARVTSAAPVQTTSRPEDAAQSVDSLNTYLASCARLCSEATKHAGGAGEGSVEPDSTVAKEDDRALRAIVEWRYGLAVALGCREHEILADDVVGRLAFWRSPPDESLPVDLAEAVKRGGPTQLASLARSLQWAVGDGGRASRQPAVPENVGENASDWNQLFDRLGWTPASASSTAMQSVPNYDAVERAIVSWHQQIGRRDLAVPQGEEATDPTNENWSVDSMTLRRLHVMSLQSRARQRRGGIGKQKAATDEAAKASPPPPKQGANNEEADADMSKFLREVLADGGDVPNRTDTIAKHRLCGLVGQTGTQPASSGTLVSSVPASMQSGKVQQGAKRGGKKKQHVVPGGQAAAHLPVVPRPGHATRQSSEATTVQNVKQNFFQLTEPPNSHMQQRWNDGYGAYEQGGPMVSLDFSSADPSGCAWQSCGSGAFSGLSPIYLPGQQPPMPFAEGMVPIGMQVPARSFNEVSSVARTNVRTPACTNSRSGDSQRTTDDSSRPVYVQAAPRRPPG
jgi:hypothetical protein